MLYLLMTVAVGLALILGTFTDDWKPLVGLLGGIVVGMITARVRR